MDGAFNALAEWTSTDVVNQGNATNHVQAICNGSYLALVVNGEVLAEVEDNTFSDGDVALSANTYEEEETVVEIHFENLVVSAPDTGLLFWDDFSDPESGWNEGEYENGSHGYVDEVYYVSVINEDWMVWGVHDVVLTEIIIDVDATVVESPEANNNAYGIMCRLQDNDDGYYLRISGDGYYRIDIREDGESSGLVDWQSSDVINQGLDTNHITAICSGTRLALIVNGELLAEVEDSTFTEGYIGLTAATYEQETTTIHFDDLVVQEARD